MDELYQITVNDNLLRRIPQSPPFVNNGEISSAAFKPSKKDIDGLSVDIEELTTYDKSVMDKTKYYLYKISASITINNDLGCLHDPQQDNYAHALITGNISSGKAKILKKNAEKIEF